MIHELYHFGSAQERKRKDETVIKLKNGRGIINGFLIMTINGYHLNSLIYGYNWIPMDAVGPWAIHGLIIIHWPYTFPDQASALWASPHSKLPNLVTFLHSLFALQVCQFIPQ